MVIIIIVIQNINKVRITKIYLVAHSIKHPISTEEVATRVKLGIFGQRVNLDIRLQKVKIQIFAVCLVNFILSNNLQIKEQKVAV